MLTRLTVRNFKLFQEVDLELGPVVVFFGPNNAGKTTAREHFYGVLEGKGDLVDLAIYDRLDAALTEGREAVASVLASYRNRELRLRPRGPACPGGVGGRAAPRGRCSGSRGGGRCPRPSAR